MKPTRSGSIFPRLDRPGTGGTCFGERAGMRRRSLCECLYGASAMKSRNLLAASGLVLSAFLIASPAMAQSEHVDANGMPTNHSTPEEQAQTGNLNSQITESNGEAAAQDNNNKAKYQLQQQQYQEQMQQHQTAQ